MARYIMGVDAAGNPITKGTGGGMSAGDKWNKWAGSLTENDPNHATKMWATFAVAVVGTFGFWLYKRGKDKKTAEAATASIGTPP